MVSLSQLSNTIIKYAEQKRDEYQKKEMQRGMALAYTNGVSQADRDELDEQERQGQALDKETTEALGAKVEKMVIHEVAAQVSASCLVGRAQYGFAVQTLQMGGSSMEHTLLTNVLQPSVNIEGQNSRV